MPEPGTVIWNELISTDVEAAKRHYCAVHGWSAMDTPGPKGGAYTVFLLGKRPVAGLMDIGLTVSPAGASSHWFQYVAVADAAASFQLALDNGARSVREPWEVPGAGVLAIVEAPDGSVTGMMQPGENWGLQGSA